MAISPLTIGIKDQAGTVQTMVVNQNAAANSESVFSLDSSQSFYRASANFTPFATSAVTLIQIIGSATKTVRIRRILIGGVSTANAQSIYQLLRVTASGTGGTAVTPTVGKNDSGAAAATAVVKHFTTAAQSTGTAAQGPLATFQVFTNVVTTPTLTPLSVCAFPELGAPGGQSLVLRGTSDILEVQNVTPANLSSGTVLCYTVEWVEDAS